MSDESLRNLVRDEARAALRRGGARARELAEAFISDHGEKYEATKIDIFIDWTTGAFRAALKARPEDIRQLSFPGFEVLDRGVLAPSADGSAPQYRLVRHLRISEFRGAIDLLLDQAASIKASAEGLEDFYTKLVAAGCSPDTTIEAFLAGRLARAAE